LRGLLFATLLLAVSEEICVSQTSGHSELKHFAFECRDVAERAEAYLSEHGIATYEKTSFQNISIIGRESGPITAGSLDRRGGRKLRPWTNVQGNDVTDSAVHWAYADRETGDKLPLGMWRIRLAHYQPWGEIKLAPEEVGCKVDFKLSFESWSANVIAILPLDDISWAYASNGRMEREYPDGISAALEQRKAVPPIRPERQP